LRASVYHALCLTVDTQFGGNRERDLVTGMVLSLRSRRRVSRALQLTRPGRSAWRSSATSRSPTSRIASTRWHFALDQFTDSPAPEVPPR
jgi:hypothetical protein